MPAMLEDALAPSIPSPLSLPPLYHPHADNSGNVSPSASLSDGFSPSPPPASLPDSLPASITPRLVTLRDRITSATLIPFLSSSEIPPGLLAHLCAQFNLEIEKGDTYPLLEPLSVSAFGAYWFQNFGAVMFLGDMIGGKDQVWTLEEAGEDWHRLCLGTFYIKPNYPGRSSHICNGGFIVTDAARNKGVGRLMGEAYLAWAPKLNYIYSVFNLVYETNVASIRIWEALGFKRIGRVKGAGNLRSSSHGLVDAIIYGRDLGPESADFVSDERFEKIRFYLKHGKYPNGADRAEKSRLRSAATHYKLVPAEDEDERASGRDTERLMLKDKEVVADAQRQYEIARQVHAHQHAGINKSTAIITEKYHWVRIKETVSLVIKNCLWCKDPSKPHTVRPTGESGSIGSSSSRPLAAPGMGGTGGGSSLVGGGRGRRTANGGPTTTGPIDPNSMIEHMVHFENPQIMTPGSDNGRAAADPRFQNRRAGTATAAAIGRGERQQMQDVRNHGFDYHDLPGPVTIPGIDIGNSNISKNPSSPNSNDLQHSYPEIPVDPRIMPPPHFQTPQPLPPIQDVVSSDMLDTSHGLIRPRRTLISPGPEPAPAVPAPAPAQVNATRIMPPLIPPSAFISDPRTNTTTTSPVSSATITTTPTPPSPLLLFDPHQHNSPDSHHDHHSQQQFINSHQHTHPHDPHNNTNNHPHNNDENTTTTTTSEPPPSSSSDEDNTPFDPNIPIPIPVDLLLPPHPHPHPHPPLLMHPHPQHHHPFEHEQMPDADADADADSDADAMDFDPVDPADTDGDGEEVDVEEDIEEDVDIEEEDTFEALGLGLRVRVRRHCDDVNDDDGDDGIGVQRADGVGVGIGNEYEDGEEEL